MCPLPLPPQRHRNVQYILWTKAVVLIDFRDSQSLKLKEMPPEIVPWDVTLHRIKDEFTHTHRHVRIHPHFEHVGCPIDWRETRSDLSVTVTQGSGLNSLIERDGRDVRVNV